jgi:hypothetical protein
MSIQKIHWTILPARAPRPVLNCHSCKTRRPFESSGKFRLNANGKRLDAWLVYNCGHCGSAWNRPIIDRQNVGDLDPQLIRNLQCNDADLAGRIAHDVTGLRRHVKSVDIGDAFTAEKKIEGNGTGHVSAIEVAVHVPQGPGPRLDKLLASECYLSRSHVEKLVRTGDIRIAARATTPLRRPVADGTVVVIMHAGEQ